MKIVEYIATVLTIIGVGLNIKKRKEGFIIWFIANIIWVVIQYRAGIYGMFFCQIIFCITCIWGWMEWRKDAVKAI